MGRAFPYKYLDAYLELLKQNGYARKRFFFVCVNKANSYLELNVFNDSFQNLVTKELIWYILIFQKN